MEICPHRIQATFSNSKHLMIWQLPLYLLLRQITLVLLMTKLDKLVAIMQTILKITYPG
jgi:hypothetical protein